jgi:hypothetical protein
MLLLRQCPFKIQKVKRTGLQVTSSDYFSLILTPLRSHWTIPLSDLLTIALIPYKMTALSTVTTVVEWAMALGIHNNVAGLIRAVTLIYNKY